MIIKKRFRLKGGIRKDIDRLVRQEDLSNFLNPQKVVIPLIQQPGVMLKPVVSKGKYVLAGQKIAESDESISVPLHSSVSGKVTEIEEYAHPFLSEKAASIIIESDGKENRAVPDKSYSDYFRYTPHELINVIRESGILGLGGEAVPAHVKLSKGRKDIDTFILNAVESDPFISCDSALIMESAKSLIAGMKIAMYILDAARGIIALSEDNPEVLQALKPIVFNEPNIFIAIVSSRYPQGEERTLIKTILGRTFGFGENSSDAGVVVNNAATVYAISRAIVNSEPLLSRVVTLVDVKNRMSKNFWTRNGTLANELVEKYDNGPASRGRFAAGSVMKGRMHDSLDFPLIKPCRGIFLLEEKSNFDYLNLDCMRCGECVRTCPANLLPNRISSLVRQGRGAKAHKYNPEACLECGSCSFVCPSFRDNSSDVRSARKEYLLKYGSGKSFFS